MHASFIPSFNHVCLIDTTSHRAAKWTRTPSRRTWHGGDSFCCESPRRCLRKHFQTLQTTKIHTYESNPFHFKCMITIDQSSNVPKQCLTPITSTFCTSPDRRFSLTFNITFCDTDRSKGPNSPRKPSASRESILRDATWSCRWPCRRNALQTVTTSWTSDPLFTLGVGPVKYTR